MTDKYFMKSGFTVNPEFLNGLANPETQAQMQALARQVKPRGIQPGQRLSLETRERMREAKLGKPKSPEHREHMSASHRLRQNIRRQVEAENPQWDIDQVWQEVRARLDATHN